MAVIAFTSCYSPYNYKTLALVKPATRTTQSELRLFSPQAYKCVVSLQATEERRSANYHPTIWEPKLIESLSTPYSYDLHTTRLEELKDEVRNLLVRSDNPCVQLKLIDSMQHLGVAYHFEDSIKEFLSLIETGNDWDLDTTSLHFRLLRQYGIDVSPDVFDKFRDEKGEFKENVMRDLEGIISLYEASHLGVEGEDSLEKSKTICRELLKSQLRTPQGSNDDDHLVEKIQHLLEMPVHWRMPRLEARNFIDLYRPSSDDISVLLLELAKLDYNLVQSLYQRELKELIRWWGNLNFKERLPFTRDRLVENYLWSMGMVSEPHSSKCRIGLTKFVCILSAIDDMYDIYASLEEVELFTVAVNRWDCEAMTDLPEYMQVCFLAMFNFGNELVYDIMTDQGVNILPNIKQAWAILCGSYLTEARWFAKGYTPTFTEYLGNAWKSVGGPSAIIHAYALHGQTILNTSFDCLKHGSKLLFWSSLITRLSDDLGTSTDENTRGDVAKAIGCYMKEANATEEEAKEHIKTLISYSWQKLNEESAKSSLPKSFVKTCINMARTAQCIYQHGDGIGTSNGVTKDHLTLLVVDPVLT